MKLFKTKIGKENALRLNYFGKRKDSNNWWDEEYKRIKRKAIQQLPRRRHYKTTRKDVIKENV